MEWVKTLIFGKRPARAIIRIVILVALVFGIFGYGVQHVRIAGVSMLPTFQPGTIRFVNKWVYRAQDPQRGDIVALRFKDSQKTLLAKRIVGLPGETIHIVDGAIFANGSKLEEPYLNQPIADWNDPPYELNSDEYFVIGDNRSMDESNHLFGVCKRSQILGKFFE